MKINIILTTGGDEYVMLDDDGEKASEIPIQVVSVGFSATERRKKEALNNFLEALREADILL